MTFTHIFIGYYSISDHVFSNRFKDDLFDILGKDGDVDWIGPQPLNTSLRWREDRQKEDEVDLGWQLERQEENTRKIFLVIPAPLPRFASSDPEHDKTLEEAIKLACRQKDDPDPAKKVETFVVLYRPCQIPPNLEGFQVFDFLPPKSYEAALQEILVALGLPSQAASKEPPATNAGNQKPVAPPKLLAAQPDAIRLARALQDHIDKVYAVALSVDGQTLASGSRDMRIRLWNPQTGSLLRPLNGHTDTVRSLTLSADGRLLVSASEDNTAKLWNTQTGQLLHTFTTIPTSELFRFEISITLSTDGSTLAVTEKIREKKGVEPMIRLWDLRRGKLLHSLKSDPRCMALSANGQILICGSGTSIYLWNARKGKQIRALSGHTDSVESVTMSADGRMLASGSWDKTIKLWNLKTGQLLHTLSGHTDTVHSIALSADGRSLASGSKNEIHLWDAQRGQLLRTLKVEKIYPSTKVLNKLNRVPRIIKSHAEAINCVAMSADGSTLVSGDHEGIVIVWGVIEYKQNISPSDSGIPKQSPFPVQPDATLSSLVFSCGHRLRPAAQVCPECGKPAAAEVPLWLRSSTTTGELTELATTYESQEKYEEAESLYLGTLAMREQQWGPQHPSVAESLNNLGVFYEDQGRNVEAEPFYGRALAICEQLFGSQHPTTLMVHENYKFLLKKIVLADNISVELLDPSEANCLSELAELSYNQGKYSEAELFYQQALTIREKQFGSQHPNMAQSLNNLAVLYEDQGRNLEAEPLYRQALAICEQQFGFQHPTTLMVHENYKFLLKKSKSNR